jgi:putative PIN family toxin of toxin-antitoxin system
MKTWPPRSRNTVPKKKAESPRLVLDSNVWISALVFGGKPREVLDLAIKGLVEIAVSDDILEEIEGVLEGKKFQYPTRVVRALMGEIESLAELVVPAKKIEVVPEDPEDDRVLECAVESGADIIVSGDSHLLELKSLGRIKIMSPDVFLRRPKKAIGADLVKKWGWSPSPRAGRSSSPSSTPTTAGRRPRIAAARRS